MAWYQPHSIMTSRSSASVNSACSRSQSSSSMLDVSWSASAARTRSRSCGSTQHGSLGSPCASDVVCSVVSSTRSAKKATWTPHSYSQPQRAHVRSIRSSRSRIVSENRLLSSYPPHSLIASDMVRFRTKVRNNKIGGSPAGIIASRRAATSGS